MIECKDITKAFGTQRVLKGLNFSANEGEILSIVGASGAGKTTLLQILGTILTPDGGEVIIDNTNVFRLSPKELSTFRNQQIGFVFQFHHLLPEFTALENIMMPALIGRYEHASKLTDKQIREHAQQLLNELGLSGKENSRPAELSGGEQQRVAIARAMINSPKIIFADEPSGNLDSKTKQELHDLFFKTREKYNQTIIIVTHDVDLAKRCDRSLELKDGVFV
ncbi:MAG: ABC transporter ATP-binding protein [Bacteroidales bacterium]|nr:ABC transporter ATP-binding protein [Bacteroidales bacterium]